MSIVLIRPGSLSKPLRLQDVLRESHEAFRESRAAEIEQRKKLGVPLDDDTNWASVAVAVAAKDGPKVVALAAGHALAPVAEYEPTPGYDAVVVTFVALSESRRRDLALEVALAQDALEAARRSGDARAARAADEQLELARGALVSAAVEAIVIDGQPLEATSDAEALDIIRASGLLVDLYVAARDYQRLSPGKGERFGSRPLST